MRSIPSAAAALCNASSLSALSGIAAGLGFSAEPLPLDGVARDALGLPHHLHEVHVARGPGELRALLAEYPRGADTRALIAATASGLSSRAPHILWLLLLTETGGSHVAIAAWASPRAARVAALIADRNRVLDSDAETVCALAAAFSSDDLATHIRWLDVLGRDALTRRFYITLRDVVVDIAARASGPGNGDERQEIALLHVSRLLFLSFLEAKNWLDGDRAFLMHSFERSCELGGNYETRVLRPLFFGTLNTRMSRRAAVARRFGRIPFLNGGLFTPTPLERRMRRLRFGDEQLGRVFSELLGRYRFTAREDSSTWSEAAIDPEMLGKAFESLMASRDRKNSGSFYTPQSLVERVTRSALVTALSERVPADVVHAALEGQVIPRAFQEDARRALCSLTVLDPSCGSGAFLVHMLDELTRLRRAAGDSRETADIRRDVLATSIFGVDINPTAVWLCELRLWLAVVIESEETDPMAVPPLPNLDHHIRVGDTLLGGDFSAAPMLRDAKPLALLRVRYAGATGNRKRVLARRMDALERKLAVAALDRAIASTNARRHDILCAQRGVDLFGERRRHDAGVAASLSALKSRARELRSARRSLEDGGALPFSFTAHFSDVGAAGGFRVVVGNPPWVRLHRIPMRAREMFRREFASFRNAAWEHGAAGAGASRGFASQVDLAALFLERSLSLLGNGAALAMLLPAKLWKSLAGGGIRALVLERAQIECIEDWSDAAPAFDAAVYPSLLVAKRAGSRAQPTSIQAVVHTRRGSTQWNVSNADLAVRSEPSAPWLLLPTDARNAFRELLRLGTPLSDTHLGRPTLGVKCGLNEAFVVKVSSTNGGLATVKGAGQTGEVETELLRPLLRGGALRAWTAADENAFIIWTHDAGGKPLARLPKHAARWFAGWQAQLCGRVDARRAHRWWSLYRTDAASNDTCRVAWSDFGKRPRAVLLPRGDRTVPLNSCYVSHCDLEDDALTLCTLLNSGVAEAWLNALAEPARGGFHRYLAWTIAMFPVPANWTRARSLLAPFGRAAIGGNVPDREDLLHAVLRAYAMPVASFNPLLEWMRG